MSTRKRSGIPGTDPVRYIEELEAERDRLFEHNERLGTSLLQLREENEGLSARNRDLEEEVEEGLLMYARDQAIAERDRLREENESLRMTQGGMEFTAELARLRESETRWADVVSELAFEIEGLSDIHAENDRLRDDLTGTTHVLDVTVAQRDTLLTALREIAGWACEEDGEVLVLQRHARAALAKIEEETP